MELYCHWQLLEANEVLGHPFYFEFSSPKQYSPIGQHENASEEHLFYRADEVRLISNFVE